MPEGPEIRKAADRIEKAVKRHPVETIFFAFEHLKPYEAELTGRHIGTVETRGKSYCYNGITNDLDLANQLKAKGQKRGQYRHWVFNREGKPCRVCGTPIVKDFANSRRFYYCPTWQPAP